MYIPLLANMGIPMLFVQWWLMACAVLPVIIIETLVVRRKIGMPLGQAVGGIAAANVLSTAIGVPLAWLTAFALGVGFLTPFAYGAERWHWQLDSPVFQVFGFIESVAWIVPANRAQAAWMVPLAAALLLIPCFFASVIIERWACRHIWRSIETSAVRHVVCRANLYSYAALFVFGCLWSVWNFYSAR
jgi:hypothetical protein